MITLKFIKKTAFKVETVEHVHYVTAYKGRIIAVSTLNIDSSAIKVDEKAGTIVLTGDFDLVNRPYTDTITSEVRSGLVLLPKLDILISQF